MNKVVEARSLTLDYPIYNAQSQSLRNVIVSNLTGGKLSKPGQSVQVVRAIDNISFSTEPGDRIGLIGHNGSGKSTLLRILANIYKPSKGVLTMKGCSTLFGAVMGLNEELTGLENLFMGSLMYTKSISEAKKRLPRLAEFSDLGEYLNLPMRTYSDGMKVRVGFSVAIDITPDILLIDEGFGAGDKNFMEKSQRKVIEIVEKCNNAFIASHSDGLISQFCNKAMLLEKGKIVDFDKTKSVLRSYHSIKN